MTEEKYQGNTVTNLPFSVWEVGCRILQSRHFLLHENTFDSTWWVRWVSTRVRFGCGADNYYEFEADEGKREKEEQVNTHLYGDGFFEPGTYSP